MGYSMGRILRQASLTVTQHIPEQGDHVVRYYGRFSYHRRGMRAKQAAMAEIKMDRSQPRGDHTSQSKSRSRTRWPGPL